MAAPTYNFCVVVDDLDMGVTHVIRGDDHINNTPRQINILQALGATPPFTLLRSRPDDSGRGRQAALQTARRGQRHAIPR
jgi:hypothetical protein